MKSIFDSLDLGKLHLKNRLIRSATWEGLADEAGHMPEALYRTYEGLAQGGVGCIISGFTSVADNDHYFGGMARLSNDALIPEHRRLTELVHRYDCPILAQTALGEYSAHGRRDIAIDDLTAGDIAEIITLFVSAAVRAKAAGYDGVQIHAAHGFFLSRFISPAYNHRTDAYGGSAGRRGAILLDILRGIRKEAPDLHITMKINSGDFIPGGLTAQESMDICKACAEAGMDSIEVSGNGTSVAGIRPGVNEAYFREFAAKLAREVPIPVILVGGHRSIANMERVLHETEIACLSLSRPLIREPDLPRRWAAGDTGPSKCVSCNLCYQTPGHQCVFLLSR
ncbi:MAG: NADH:flavin oxidoreductase [Oscillibacter sp.]|nr:NADH:flavin oxidoreductase [Oscillibacter sp.]